MLSTPNPNPSVAFRYPALSGATPTFEHVGPTAPMGALMRVSRSGQPWEVSLADPHLCSPQHLLLPLTGTAHFYVVIGFT